MNTDGKGGFQDRDPEKKFKDQQKGGRTKNPNKGFGSLSAKQRSEISRKAVNKRWEKYYKERENDEQQQNDGI
jgi:hypothetical protein